MGRSFHLFQSETNLHPDKADAVSISSMIKDLKAVAWMILLGDALHNFMDGVAIGVAFSEGFPAGLQGGISTSIAILCHELPHELGRYILMVAFEFLHLFSIIDILMPQLFSL